MNIDLEKVIGYSKDCLQSRALMRSVILDLYPDSTREMNVLLDVYESGIPREIKNSGKISDAQYFSYIQRIEQAYGLKEQYIVEALNLWIDASLGKGTAATLSIPSFESKKDELSVNTAPKPIVHAPIEQKQVQSVSGSASDFEVQGNSDLTIVKFRGFEERELVVPNTINGKKVKIIGQEAYKKCSIVEKIIVSEGIEIIEDMAFAECKNLKEIILPSTLKCIGSKNKTNYSSVIKNKTSIGAFSNTAIRSINLPASLNYLGKETFALCEKLEKVDLPNDIKNIGEYTFYNCKSLRKVYLPDELESIGSWGFARSAISEITFPVKVKEIGSLAFDNCKSLSNVRLNEGLQTIKWSAFAGCESLNHIIIPSTVTFDGDAFSDTYNKNKNLVIYCYAGSAAIDFARKYGYEMKNAATINA